MAIKIFVNLPTRDLARARAFWTALGFSFNGQFSDETAACLKFSEDVYAMLLTHAKFSEFTDKTIIDTATSTEVILALAADSRAEVDRLAETALKVGGRESSPAKDYGFMLQRAFMDPDGHNWEVFHMDPSFVQLA